MHSATNYFRHPRKHVLSVLNMTLTIGIWFSRERGGIIKAYSAADCGQKRSSRNSFSVYCFMYQMDFSVGTKSNSP